MTNTYDKHDMIRREAAIIAGALKLAAYTVRDPETGEYGPLQFHMTWDNTVMAVMGEEAAKLFARFVTDTVTARLVEPIIHDEMEKLKQKDAP